MSPYKILKKNLKGRLLVGERFISNGHWAVPINTCSEPEAFSGETVARVWAGNKVDVAGLSPENEKFLAESLLVADTSNFIRTRVKLQLRGATAILFVCKGKGGLKNQVLALDENYVKQFEVYDVFTRTVDDSKANRTIADQVVTPDGVMLMSMRIDKEDIADILSVSDAMTTDYETPRLEQPETPRLEQLSA